MAEMQSAMWRYLAPISDLGLLCLKLFRLRSGLLGFHLERGWVIRWEYTLDYLLIPDLLMTERLSAL
jgi:hypothetical protein